MYLYEFCKKSTPDDESMKKLDLGFSFGLKMS